MNFAHLTQSRQHFEVSLTRKSTPNAVQNARARVEHVRAKDKDEAKALALAMPQNAAYKVSSVREVR